MNAKQIIRRLEEFDTEMFLEYPETDRRMKIVIIGGAALLLHQCIQRSTNDIDIIQFDGQLNLEMLAKYDMDIRSHAFCGNFSDTMDERYLLVPANTKMIDYYIPSLEDLVISKLSSDRRKDTLDIKQNFVYEKVDLGKLEEIMQEIHLSIFGHALSTLMYDYEDFRQRKEEYDDGKRKR
jgi:hypothetical protein